MSSFTDAVVQKLNDAANHTIYASEKDNYETAMHALDSVTDVFGDICDMHSKFGVHEWVENASKEQLLKFLQFRLSFLDEELNETKKAVSESDPEEIVDGLIDLIVVASGTLDAFGIDSKKAWDQVHNANMSKTPGVKETRPNPLGLPDLIKPEGWKSPDHSDNHGMLTKAFGE